VHTFFISAFHYVLIIVYIIDEEHFLWSYNGKLFLLHSTGHGKFLLYLPMKSINNITLKIMKAFIIYHSRTEEVFSLQNV